MPSIRGINGFANVHIVLMAHVPLMNRESAEVVQHQAPVNMVEAAIVGVFCPNDLIEGDGLLPLSAQLGPAARLVMCICQMLQEHQYVGPRRWSVNRIVRFG